PVELGPAPHLPGQRVLRQTPFSASRAQPPAPILHFFADHPLISGGPPALGTPIIGLRTGVRPSSGSRRRHGAASRGGAPVAWREMRSEAEAIDHLVATAPRAGCFFDFDGTLAPIQLDPDSVWPTPGMVDALSALTSLISRVAVVS